MRNALQDAALVRTFDANTKARVLDGVWPWMAARLPIGPVSLRAHPEVYLSLRQRIWKVAGDLVTIPGKTLQ